MHRVALSLPLQQRKLQELRLRRALEGPQRASEARNEKRGRGGAPLYEKLRQLPVHPAAAALAASVAAADAAVTRDAGAVDARSWQHSL
ncbi:hypothetical protein cyc_07851 [Cyclospora cayetanensis]|uniref:Uncharacterized protein n=1 Tax=Cyclospora cayetanensis TaxID=88456 RepID=A0A1D3D0I2_9EIME|nr:hypothetical protein cyc_07851 [Cyclospora cayetanensis]